MAKSATELKETDYAHPEVLVDTQWVAEHASDPKVQLVEVDVDTAAYDSGHVKGAIGLDGRKDLQARPVRDLLPKEGLEKLLSSKGISNEDTIVVYGDNNNWFAAWFVWNLKYYGHRDARLMNGGRKKWQDEGRARRRRSHHPAGQLQGGPAGQIHSGTPRRGSGRPWEGRGGAGRRPLPEGIQRRAAGAGEPSAG